MAVPKNLKTEVLNSLIEEQSPETESYVQEKIYLNNEIEMQVRLEELKTLQEHNKTLAQNNNERKKYAKFIFALTVVWAALIFVIIFLIGNHNLDISDSVVITLISSTTINFFGFFLLVIKYLFNTNNGMVIKQNKLG